jgi:copper chaperone CopZ
VNKSLQRQDGVEKSNTSLETQSATVTFKKGKVIDFQKLAKAVDSAGFKAAEIKIRATGAVEESDGQLVFKVSGSNQTFPVKGDAEKLKGLSGREVKVAGKLEFDKKPPPLLVETIE